MRPIPEGAVLVAFRRVTCRGMAAMAGACTTNDEGIMTLGGSMATQVKGASRNDAAS